MSVMYSTLRLKAQTVEALRAAQGKAESFDTLCQRLLSLAGYAAAVLPPDWKPPQGRAPSKYAALDTLTVGQTARLPWRGVRGPDGVFHDSQSAVYMAVRRCEARTGFLLQLRGDGEGLRVTRIK